MKKAVLVLFSFLLMISCTKNYNDFKLNEDTFEVSFEGSPNTSKEKAFQLALKHSAEVTRNNGYKYFKVIKSSSNTSRQKKIQFSPIESTSTSNYRSRVNGRNKNQKYDYSGESNGDNSTTISGGDIVTEEKPVGYWNIKVYMTIKLYKNHQSGLMDADAILSNFK